MAGSIATHPKRKGEANSIKKLEMFLHFCKRSEWDWKMFGTVLEMRKYALHYHLWYDTHPRQRSIKCKTDNWWSGSREHLLQKSSKRPIIEFRFGISSSLPRFHALNPVIWKFWKSISCCTRIWQLRTGGLFPFRIILYYACALQFHGFVELLLICRRLCGIDDLWWFWRRVAKTLAQSVLITYFF